ncbi:MAG: ABC transporter permease, partial [Lachnospiraceae bacterium]|nr:ABC transporter permease [Lachnospiraceae bacterium]
AKGLAENKVITKHALRNALIPTVTVIGLQMGSMLGGSVLTESVFSWPGIGRFMIQSIQGRDIPGVMGTIILFALIFACVNLVVDLIYGFLDPRIKAQYK